MNTDINDIRKTCYPSVTVDLNKLYDNTKLVTDACRKDGITVAGIVKGCNGIPEVGETMLRAGCTQLGTSRMDQIIDMKSRGMDDVEYLLVRIPMLSEAEEVAAYADISLQSELSVIRAVNDACGKFGTHHDVILMADLGDLREGFWDRSELVEAALCIENSLDNINLRGVGTNLGCYGSIKPNLEKMNELVSIAEAVESAIGRKLEIISGGATSSYPLVLEGAMPPRINHLRIGEGILLAYDLKEIWGLDMSGMRQDVFTLKAEVVEVREKPSHPVGEIFIDCFGRKPEYEDRGIRKRAILAMGKLDFALNDKIFPRIDGVEVIGSSSDHCILDIEDCRQDILVGDILEFDLSYPSLMYLTGSRYVNIEIKKQGVFKREEK